MIKAILNGILKVIQVILNVLLLPVNALFNGLFPSMTQSIANFNTFVTTYVGGTLSYFFNLLPPIFKTTLSIWLTFIISYYTIYYTYTAFVKIFAVIQKIKFW